MLLTKILYRIRVHHTILIRKFRIKRPSLSLFDFDFSIYLNIKYYF